MASVPLPRCSARQRLRDENADPTACAKFGDDLVARLYVRGRAERPWHHDFTGCKTASELAEPVGKPSDCLSRIPEDRTTAGAIGAGLPVVAGKSRTQWGRFAQENTRGTLVWALSPTSEFAIRKVEQRIY